MLITKYFSCVLTVTLLACTLLLNAGIDNTAGYLSKTKICSESSFSNLSIVEKLTISFDDSLKSKVNLEQGGVTIVLASPFELKDAEKFYKQLVVKVPSIFILEVKTKVKAKNKKVYNIATGQYANSKEGESRKKELVKLTGIKDAYFMKLDAGYMQEIKTFGGEAIELEKKKEKEKEKIKQEPFNGDVTKFLNSLKSIIVLISQHKYTSLNNYCLKDVGVYLLSGTKENVKYQHFEAFSDLFAKDSLKLMIKDYPLSFENIPIFDCTSKKWDKEGCFTHSVEKEKILSKYVTTKTNDAEAKKEIEKLKKVESKISRVYFQTGSPEQGYKFHIYLTLAEGSWYIVALDNIQSCN